MAVRRDSLDFSFDPDEVPKYSKTASFTGFVSKDRRDAEREALQLRLAGTQAKIQNGLNGHYEVIAVKRQEDLRVFTAKEFKSVGAGVYVAAQPEWDAGSVWAVHSNSEDGTILLARVDDEDIPEMDGDIVQSSTLGVEASITKRAYNEGDAITYVDQLNNVVTGSVKSVDQHAAGYWVHNPVFAGLDFVPFDESITDIDDETEELLALKDIEDDLEEMIEDHEEIVLD